MAKHAGASEAAVILCKHCSDVQPVVSDNGCGFDPAMVSRDHFGLTIMRERASAIGAALTMASQVGQDTRVIGSCTS